MIQLLRRIRCAFTAHDWQVVEFGYKPLKAIRVCSFCKRCGLEHSTYLPQNVQGSWEE